MHSVYVSAILFSRFIIDRLKRSQENGSQEEEGSQAVVLVRTHICTASARAGNDKIILRWNVNAAH